MGSQQFEVRRQVPKKQSDQDAFSDAVDSARHENGHGGYSGTIAEKNSCISIHRARSEQSAQRIVNALMGHAPIPIYRDEMMQVTDDKWGPAGAVRYPVDSKTDGIIFFGWASS
tara:strand:+ start:1018 stop:1359 length:342 start_codon:yes stop_codon:yes gene_type:complete